MDEEWHPCFVEALQNISKVEYQLDTLLEKDIPDRAWNRILVLLPYRAAQPVFSDDFYGYFGYPLGGVTFDVVTVRMFVYAVITLMCIPFVRKTWRKHQVA